MKFELLEKGAVLSEEQQERRNLIASVKLIVVGEMGGGDAMVDWISQNEERFDELLMDPEYDLFNLFANKDTREVALQKMKDMINN